MKWEPGAPRFGDLIRVRIGSVYHYGVFASENEVIAFGYPPAAEYRDLPDRFLVVSTDIDVFSHGSIVERASLGFAERRRRIAPDKTVALARSRIGEDGYNIIHNNCEHFANECVFGVRRSEQEEEARKKWLSRPICDVYLARVSDFPDGSPVLPPERREEIDGCRNEELRKARIADWRLLAIAAERSLAVDLGTAAVKKAKTGRWCAEGFDFSLSHTADVVAVAVSNGAVGVDTENADGFAAKRSPDTESKIRERFFTDSEKASYPEGTVPFLTCWTRKEAIFKRSARGTFDPSRIETSVRDVATFTVPEFPGAVVSVCSDNAERLRVFVASGGSCRLAAFQKIT